MSNAHVPAERRQRPVAGAETSRHATRRPVVAGYDSASPGQALAVLGRRAAVHTQPLPRPLGRAVLPLRLRALRLLLDPPPTYTQWMSSL